MCGIQACSCTLASGQAHDAHMCMRNLQQKANSPDCLLKMTLPTIKNIKLDRLSKVQQDALKQFANLYTAHRETIHPSADVMNKFMQLIDTACFSGTLTRDNAAILDVQSFPESAERGSWLYGETSWVSDEERQIRVFVNTYESPKGWDVITENLRGIQIRLHRETCESRSMLDILETLYHEMCQYVFFSSTSLFLLLFSSFLFGPFTLFVFTPSLMQCSQPKSPSLTT